MRHLANRDQGTPCEFTFSIYRTTTGDISGGVLCSVEARSWRWQQVRKDKFTERSQSEKPEQLAEAFGYYTVPSIRVTNGVTQTITLPAGLFKNHFATRQELAPRLAELRAKPDSERSPDEKEELKLLEDDAGGQPRPPLQIWVQCTDRTQFVGMAKYDLYLLDSEQPFWLNFYKGVLGIWLFNVLVVAMGVCFSTTLNGVVSWLVAMTLIGLGWLRDYLQSVAAGTNEGGGPAEAWLKLINGQMPSGILEETTTKKVADASDEVFRWFMRGTMNLFPDVARLDFGNRVSSGFDVPVVDTVLVTAVFLLAYLIPLAVIAYYLIKSREIASST
jgi:hypothetical protein